MLVLYDLGVLHNRDEMNKWWFQQFLVDAVMLAEETMRLHSDYARNMCIYDRIRSKEIYCNILVNPNSIKPLEM